MSTIDTGLKNLNIWEGTLEQIENNRAEIGINDFALATDVSFEEQFRFSVMPPAVEANVGKVVQYIGGDTETYKTGSYYKCVQELSYIDTIEADGCSATMTNRTLFEEVCITRSSAIGRRIDYWELTPRDEATGTSQLCSIKSYNKSGTYLGKVTSTSLSTVEEMFGVKTTGSVGLNTKIRFYRGTPYVQNPAATVTPSDTEIINSYSIDVYQLMVGYLVPNDLENENQTIVLTYNGDNSNWYNGDTVVGGASQLFSLYGVTIALGGSLYDGITLTIDYTTPIEGYTWVIIQSGTSVGFEEVVGNPRDNEALDEELDRIEFANAIQVTELPEITEDTKNRIYQYVGEDDFDNQLYTGSFYKAYGSTYELDSEHSQYIDDMSFIVNNESQFLQVISSIYSSYPELSDQSYIDIVFYGSGGGSYGYGNAWWIDQSVRPDSPYCPWNEQYSDLYGGIKFGGQPTINNTDTNPNTTDNTYFHILISKPNADYQYWNWYPISTYPYQHITSSQVLVNKSRYDTSIIDKKSGDNINSDGPNNTVIGVHSNGSPSGFSTIFGFNNWGNYLSTVVGAYNRNIASASIVIGANTRGTSGEYGICIGVDSGSGERAIAIGPSAQSRFRSVAIGRNANAADNYDIAIGDATTASGSWSLAIGSEASSTAHAAVALGYKAKATAQHAVQICEGTNATTGSLQFRNYVLVENDGTIPVQRLSTSTPQDGYSLVYNNNTGKAQWQSLSEEIPVIQVTEIPEAEEGMVVQYIGEDDGELIKGYWYEAVYDTQGDYWYWNQINVQPTINTVSYNDVTDKPSISGVTIEGDLDLVEDFDLARVAQTGSYADLTTKPGINGHALLANTTAADLQISYNDLIDKPADPSTQLPDLPDDKDNYDYMLKWDHVQGKLVWYRATDTQEDLGVLPEPTNE